MVMFIAVILKLQSDSDKRALSKLSNQQILLEEYFLFFSKILILEFYLRLKFIMFYCLFYVLKKCFRKKITKKSHSLKIP